MFALLLCFILSPLAHNLTSAKYSNYVSYFNGLMYPGFFWLGMLCERIRRSCRATLLSRWPVVLLTGVLVILLVRVFPPPMGVDRLARATGSAMVVLGLYFSTGWVKAFMSLPTFVLLGDASYALYLLHGPCHSGMEIILKRFSLPATSDSITSLLIYLAVSIALSILALKTIEVPARKWIIARFGSNPIQGNASTS